MGCLWTHSSVPLQHGLGHKLRAVVGAFGPGTPRRTKRSVGKSITALSMRTTRFVGELVGARGQSIFPPVVVLAASRSWPTGPYNTLRCFERSVPLVLTSLAASCSPWAGGERAVSYPMKAARAFGKALIRAAGRFGLYEPLATYCTRQILATVSGPPDAPLLLFLTSERFRGDLDALRETGAFRLAQLPRQTHLRLLGLFYGSTRPEFARRKSGIVMTAGDATRRANAHSFLASLLHLVFKRVEVAAVISPAVYYWQDQEIGEIAESIGYPYVVFHRENFVDTPAQKKAVAEALKKTGRFTGSRVVLQNRAMATCFIEAGIVDPNAISVLGTMRMDKFVRQAKAGTLVNRTGKRRVTLFSFPQIAGLYGRSVPMFSVAGLREGFVELFDQAHVVIAKLAIEHPEIDFVIKTKWLGQWVEAVDAALGRHGIERRSIQNLDLRHDLDPHQLIADSDVICSFGSTTLLEAAIAKKPIIVPLFAEAADPSLQPYVHFLDRLPELFTVARSPSEFGQLIVESLSRLDIDQTCMKARWKAFNESVSDTSGDATPRYVHELKNIIDGHRAVREQAKARLTSS